MSSVLALIPARTGSKGIPGKNFRRLGGRTLVGHAMACSFWAHVDECVISTDRQDWGERYSEDGLSTAVLYAPAPLHQDDTPMIDVIRDALARIPGPPDQIIVLLQPTQPLRTPEHVRKAIALLQEHEQGCPAIADDESDYEYLDDAGMCVCKRPDSVVSVTPLPLTHSPELVLRLGYGNQLSPWGCDECANSWNGMPKRRQDAERVYMRDGTVYAFRRATIERTQTLFGYNCQALIITPEETCELDTEADWQVLEARWRALHG